jgi:Tfp pilus assembly protein PilO
MKSIITFIFVISGFALLFGFSQSLWNDILSIRAEREVVGDTLSRLTDLQRLRDELLDVFNGIPRDKRDRLLELLPESPEIGTLLITLEKITTERGLLLNGISFDAPKKKTIALSNKIEADQPKTKILGYSFSVASSYDVFKSLLSTLENNLRIVDVNDISFSGDAVDLFNFSLRAQSYYQE